MAKEELLEFDGTVVEVLPDGNYRVKLDNEHIILAYAAGKMKKNRIRTIAGDRVIVEGLQKTAPGAKVAPEERKAAEPATGTGAGTGTDEGDGSASPATAPAN